MQDLAIVSHGTEGVGFAHVYGAFNLAYGVGNASKCHMSRVNSSPRC
jgi:hypothetical protein